MIFYNNNSFLVCHAFKIFFLKIKYSVKKKISFYELKYISVILTIRINDDFQRISKVSSICIKLPVYLKSSGICNAGIYKRNNRISRDIF